MSDRPLPKTLYEMLRSFSTVARTLNIARAKDELRLTRQTVTRHIHNLEELLGHKLFEQKNRQIILTNKGSELLIPTDLLLNQTSFLFRKSTMISNGLSAVKAQIADDHWFYAQRHKITDVMTKSPPLIQAGFRSWVASDFHLYHQAIDEIRPYIVVYRRNRDDWICIEIGEQSSYATWLGSDWAKSAVGLSFQNDPIKSDADKFMLVAHDNVLRTGTAWYEHVATKFARQDGGPLVPVNYQRLVLPIKFPDDTPGIIVLIARTNNVELYDNGERLDDLPTMDEKESMDFDI